MPVVRHHVRTVEDDFLHTACQFLYIGMRRYAVHINVRLFFAQQFLKPGKVTHQMQFPQIRMDVRSRELHPVEPGMKSLRTLRQFGFPENHPQFIQTITTRTGQLGKELAAQRLVTLHGNDRNHLLHFGTACISIIVSGKKLGRKVGHIRLRTLF